MGLDEWVLTGILADGIEFDGIQVGLVWDETQI
jgi:hypothetical protein